MLGKVDCQKHFDYQTNKGQDALNLIKSCFFLPFIYILAMYILGRSPTIGMFLRVIIIVLFLFYINVWSKDSWLVY